MSKTLVCPQCGYIGNSKSAIKGSGGVELLLWLFFIIPGLIYSVWRSSSRHPVCPKCGNDNMIPSDTPRAKKIMSESMSEEEVKQTIDEETAKEAKKKKKNLIGYIVIIGIVLILAIISFSNM